MKRTLLSAIAGLAAVASAEVGPGENILMNGIFEADQSVLPVFWISQNEKAFVPKSSGGPGGKPILRVVGDADARNGEISIRQYGLHLAEKGRYRLSAYVRTKDFKADRCGIGIANHGWQKGSGSAKIPEDTAGEWRLLENEFECFPSEGGNYFAYIYTTRQSGVLEVADVRLVALDETALKGTQIGECSRIMLQPRLIPFSPLLWQIPRADPAVTFRYYGRNPPGAVGDYDAVLKAEDAPGETRAPLAANRAGRPADVRLRLPAGAKGGRLTVSIVRRADGTEVFSETRTFRVTDAPAGSVTQPGKRFNNLCTEILREPLAAGTNRLAFTKATAGWVYVAVKASAGKGFCAALDRRVIIDAKTPRFEAFRFLEPGDHLLEVENAGVGDVVVRAIAETFNYCPGQNSGVGENPPYDWEYQKRFGLKSVTTENGGSIPDKALAEFRSSGRRWLVNLGTTDLKADELVARLGKTLGGMKAAGKYDGVTCDEQAFVKVESINEFVKGLKAYDFAESPESLIYVWVIGKPASPSLDHDLIATCVNASRGRGKVMMEAYLGTQETEEEALQRIQTSVIDRIARFREWYPLSIPNLGFALGNFNQVPILSLSHHPAVDYKYYLDLQMNRLANDPACRDLGTVGYWGSYYADDELHRWSFELLRHYVIEGRREMLSERYGFRYRPEHLGNGDFRGTLEPWTASGEVRLDSHGDFAVRSQNRWFSRGGVGDTFATLVRGKGAPATLRQTARGLVPGRMYCLQFATFDVKDVKSNALNPRRFGIDATIDGGEVCPELSWTHVDRRKNGRYKNNNGVARINLRHIVFTARGETAEITLDNAAAAEGEELGVNYVSLNPYFPAEAGGAKATAKEPVRKNLKVRVGETPVGPRLLVNGKVANPRFYYGSPTCLCNISGVRKTVIKVPFAADVDTDGGRVAFDGYYGVDPLWWSDAKLVDLTAGTTNVVLGADEEVRTLNYAADGLKLVRGHRYHFVVTHRATRFRTYFTIGVSRPDGSGGRVKIPYYYGDTLGEAVRLAATAGVDLVTFSTDSSWGCEGWWNPPEGPEDYGKIDAEFERLVKINPRALLVPRITADAPVWLLKRHPEMRMIYDTGFNLAMSSVSSRPYRKAACEAVEKLSRHLKERFPDNYAGLQISGQNSAEWFYMMSQSENLSGYDVPTRDAFREWLKDRGAADWATAEVPTSAARHLKEKDGRLLEFARFRQREMASFLAELGEAAKRGSRGEALTLFFYGYSWEIGGVTAGAAETGHFDFDWLMRNAKGKIDGFSAPLSYSCRNLTGSTVVMSAAETVMRNGYLWFNEIDHRTHHEEMWDHMSLFNPYTDPAITREIFFRDSAADILRGYGDWWMDLFGRGWFGDREIWGLRKELNRLDEAMLRRSRPFEPEIANVVSEESFLRYGWMSGAGALLNRRGFARCGATYGQYFLSDILANPPASVKLFYITIARDLSAEDRRRLDALKASRPDATFVENVTPADLTAESIGARAKAAGVHCYAAPGKANVCAAEGFVLVQALKEGPLAVDFGRPGAVTDFLTGKTVGAGPSLTIPFRRGETRLFRQAQCKERPGR